MQEKVTEYKLVKADKNEVKELLNTLTTQKIQIKELYDISESFSNSDELQKDVSMLKVKLTDMAKTLKDKIEHKDLELINTEISRAKKSIQNQITEYNEFKSNTEKLLLQLNDLWTLIRKLENSKLNRED